MRRRQELLLAIDCQIAVHIGDSMESVCRPFGSHQSQIGELGDVAENCACSGARELDFHVACREKGSWRERVIGPVREQCRTGIGCEGKACQRVVSKRYALEIGEGGRHHLQLILRDRPLQKCCRRLARASLNSVQKSG